MISKTGKWAGLAIVFILVLAGSYVLAQEAQEYEINKVPMSMKDIDPSLAPFNGTRFAVHVEYYTTNFAPLDEFSKLATQAFGGFLFGKNVADLAKAESEQPKPEMTQFKKPLGVAQSMLKKSMGFVSNLINTGSGLLSKIPTAIPGIGLLTLVPKMIGIVNTTMEHLKTVQTEGPKVLELISSLLNTFAK